MGLNRDAGNLPWRGKTVAPGASWLVKKTEWHSLKAGSTQRPTMPSALPTYPVILKNPESGRGDRFFIPLFGRSGCFLFLFFLLILGSGGFSQVGAKKACDRRVERLLQETDLKFEIDSDGDFRLGDRLDDGRTQLIWVLSRTSELGSMEIREIWSIAHRSKLPPSETLANRLLRENAKVKIGAWQVRKMGEDYVVVFCAQIAAETDKVSLLVACHAVSVTADELEKDLSKQDAW